MDFNLLSFLLLNLAFLCRGNLSVNSCPSYMCKPEKMHFDEFTCVYYDQTLNIYYSRECKMKNTLCYQKDNQNTTCEETFFVFSYPQVGEKCSENLYCNFTYLVGCVNGICKGQGVGNHCNSNYDCNPGLYCHNDYCAPQIAIGQKGCLSDYDCVNNGGCNITSATDRQANTCYQSFSFEPHDPIGNCIDEKNRLCKYLNCAQNGANNNYYCSEPMVSQGMMLQCLGSCQSQQDIFFDPPFYATTACTCGYNKNRTAYCELNYGDGPGLKLLSYLASWYASAAIWKCNTNRRDSFNCIKDFWDEKSYHELYYWYNYFNVYSLLHDSEQCVVNTVAYQYAYALTLDGKNDFDDNDSAITFAVSIVIGFVFS